MPWTLGVELALDHTLVTWEPGREIRFCKNVEVWPFGCAVGAFFFLALPLIPATLVALKSPHAMLFLVALGAMILLYFGGAALLCRAMARRGTVVFDWTERKLHRRTIIFHTSCDFADLRAIELKRLSATEDGTSHYCHVIAQLAPAAANPAAARSIEIVSTALYPDPDPSYRMALPLATELAKALDVPVVFTTSFF